jgi:hypothetical protein
MFEQPQPKTARSQAEIALFARAAARCGMGDEVARLMAGSFAFELVSVIWA